MSNVRKWRSAAAVSVALGVLISASPSLGAESAAPIIKPGPICVSCPLNTAPSILLRRKHVVQQIAVVNGLKVDKFSWLDSKGRTRSVSLKRQGEGNPGNGGYAVQMTYQYRDGNVWKTAIVNPQTTETPLEGFGYFVGHERFRNFQDGTSATIAGKIFNVDDSPRGLDFPVTSIQLYSSYAGRKAIRFRLNYPKYGTIEAHPVDANAQDNPGLPLTPSFYKLYQLPVWITWYFQAGKDFPRIKTQVGLENVPGPDRISFDVRGPYGAMNFDEDAAAPIMRVTWNDRFRFYSDLSRNKSLTRNSTWNWNANDFAPPMARYSSLATATAEMGLVEPRRYAASQTRDGYSGARGLDVTQYNSGQGCAFQNQKLPCDYEWPYQSVQYSLPYDNPNGTTNFRKMAWGSAPFYGMSLQTLFDTSNTSQAFNGFPAIKRIGYDVCVVLAKNYNGDGFGDYAQSSRVALNGGDYNCATTLLQKPSIFSAKTP